MKFQLQLEDFYTEIAKNDDNNVILITDRGAMDPLAYTTPKNRKLILGNNKELIRENLIERYDMVIHMVSAADGAEKYYSLENNAARTEGVEQAKKLDHEILEMWTGAPNHM